MPFPSSWSRTVHKTEPSPRNSAHSWMRCLLFALICASCALAMTSCSTGTKATRADPPTFAPPQPPPPLQANLRVQCPETLPPATSDLVPALLANHDAVTAIYRDCRDSNKSLLQALAEWRATALAWYCQAVAAAGLSVTDCPGKPK